VRCLPQHESTVCHPPQSFHHGRRGLPLTVRTPDAAAMTDPPSGTLPPFAWAALTTFARLHDQGTPALHARALARQMPAAWNASRRYRNGALYQTLAQLVGQGLLEQWREDTHAEAGDVPAARPHHWPRRSYRLTAAGWAALGEADRGAADSG
jgi:hypothetical protein